MINDFYNYLVEVKVFFSRQFESMPKVNAWVIGDESLFKIPPKSITISKTYFMAKISLNPDVYSRPNMHWTAYTEQDTNEQFSSVMQSIMSHSKTAYDDLKELVRKYESGDLLYLTDSSGQNLMHAAAQAGNCKLMQILIDKGVDYDLRDNHGWTPLTVAIDAGNLEAANFLISKNASLLNTTISNGTLLHYLMKSPRK